jgi:flagellar hook-associated protein 3 FlgL
LGGWNNIYNTVTYALSLHTQALTQIQNEASSGIKVAEPSDDPSDAYQILKLQQQIGQDTTFSSNVDTVSSVLQAASASLQSISSGLVTVQQQLTEAANGTSSASDRQAIAAQIDSILEQSVSSANTQIMGEYIFGGSATTSAPYTVQRTNGAITSVTYQGNSSSIEAPISDGVSQAETFVGNTVFNSSQRQAPVFMGNTGAKAGSGTSSVTGDQWLEVTHGTTSYAAGSGIAAGANSASGDTIVGAHTVTIANNGSTNTIALDDGPAVAFTGSESDLELTNSSGDVAYIDMTGWTGVTGPVSVTSSANLSLDNGVTTTAVNSFTNNVAVTDAAGNVLYVDTTGLQRTGAEPVSIPGTHDLFNALISMRDILNNTQSMTSAQQTSAITQALTTAQELSSDITLTSTVIGSRLQALDTLKTNITNSQASVQSVHDSLQDADITQVAIDLSREQTLYELTLSAASKLMSLSLMDYINGTTT